MHDSKRLVGRGIAERCDRGFTRRYGSGFRRCGIGLGPGVKLEEIERVIGYDNFLRCLVVSF
jgi:hypothetical protein